MTPNIIRSSAPLFVDTDNALGSDRGDVDDGFALAALFTSRRPVSAIASVWGNASEPESHRNSIALAHVCGGQGQFARGAGAAGGRRTPASRLLACASEPSRVLALGPLTNVAAALEENPSSIAELITVGSNLSSWGRWPPYFPHEFNLTQDPWATRTVMQATCPITVVPLDVASRLRADSKSLARLPGAVGEYLRDGSRRWLRRNYWRGRRSFAVWDLVAAMYVLSPDLFRVEARAASARANGGVSYRDSGRIVQVIVDYVPSTVWQVFETLVSGLG